MDILLVEDEPQLAGQICRALTRAGHAVTHAGDGPDGLKAVTGARFDLVLLDVNLPGFDGFELLARIRVAMRHRGTALAAAVTEHHREDLHIDLTLRSVQSRGETLHLTPTEFKLLARLVRSAGQVVTHRQLLADVWGAEHVDHTHYLRLYMGQLRAKLEAEPAEPQRLLTEPGVGYRLVEGEPDAA